MSNTRAIEGRDVLLRAYRDSVLILFACSTSIDFTYDRELITKTTVSSGSFREYAYRLGEWGFSLGMVTHVKPKTNMYTVFDLMELMKGGQTLDIELSFIDSEGNAKTITGKVLIPSVGITSPVEGFSEDNVEFRGSGAFEIITEIITTDPGSDPGNGGEYVSSGLRTFNYDTVANESVITNAQLAGKNVVMAMIDGIPKKIIIAGTPNDKQIKFLSDGGSLVLPFTVEPGIWICALYQ